MGNERSRIATALSVTSGIALCVEDPRAYATCSHYYPGVLRIAADARWRVGACTRPRVWPSLKTIIRPCRLRLRRLRRRARFHYPLISLHEVAPLRFVEPTATIMPVTLTTGISLPAIVSAYVTYLSRPLSRLLFNNGTLGVSASAASFERSRISGPLHSRFICL